MVASDTQVEPVPSPVWERNIALPKNRSWLLKTLYLTPRILRRQKGFSLIEVLVAQAIIGAVGVVFMVAMGSAFDSQGRTQTEFKAEHLARMQLEYLRHIPYDANNYDDDVPPPDAFVPAGYSITVTSEAYCDGIGEAGFEPCYNLANIQKNTVTVSRGGRAATIIEDLKTRR
jgi:prepilin-type N-terminal cleavage/methylation domain-containing protein